MTTKEYLQQYRRLVVRIRNLEDDIARLEAEIGSSGGTGDGMPKSTEIADPTARYAIQLAELKAKRNRMRSEAWAKRDEIQDVIESVGDPVCARLLHDRYILCMRWEEIAIDLNYEPNYTRTKLHRRALGEVIKKTQKDSFCL